ncbi:MAG TPA: baseplate J/gp47 family protein [Ktedonobacteraceae bacterium]
MSQYAREIKSILASLYEQGDEDAPPLLEEEENLDTLHVYPVEGGGILLTRTPLNEEEPAASVIESQFVTRATPRSPSPFVLFLLLLCLFLVGDLADTQLIDMMTPTATIAITPEVHTVRLHSTASLGRLLSPITLSESLTVPATGHGHQDARAATGTLTFYNGALQPVPIAAGTILTAQTGVQIVTIQQAIIPVIDPMTTPPTVGQVTVTAQTVQVGATGNLAAFAVSEACCAASVLVKNLVPFSGGQDARDFPVVKAADRDHAAASLQARVTASMSAALQEQLLPGQVLHRLPCVPTVTADHQIGEEASFLTVMVSETCTAVAYDEQQVKDTATRLLTVQAARTFGTGYTLVGLVQVNISSVITSQTSPQVTLAFTGTGTVTFLLTALAQQHLKAVLVGEPRLVALRWLMQQPGIQHASISGVSDDQSLPNDPALLHLLLVVPL